MIKAVQEMVVEDRVDRALERENLTNIIVNTVEMAIDINTKREVVPDVEVVVKEEMIQRKEEIKARRKKKSLKLRLIQLKSKKKL